jgi:endonuclease/exonuclease/phosphatase family metal-dependent hydrolase
MLIWSIYRAPDAPLPNFIDTLNSKISLLPQDVELVLLGDFNVDVLAKRNTSSHGLKQRLNLFASANNLNQLIDTPTRINELSSTAIDLILLLTGPNTKV